MIWKEKGCIFPVKCTGIFKLVAIVLTHPTIQNNYGTI